MPAPPLPHAPGACAGGHGPLLRRAVARWQQLVTPAWLAALLGGQSVEAAPAGEWRLFEVGCHAITGFLHGHVPGAAYLDTHDLEGGPLWNKLPDRALLRILLERGIRHDTTVLLYGRNDQAAARAAHLLLYAGVKDVGLLDGGFEAWATGAHPVMPGPALERPSVTDFGDRFPGHPEYLLDTRRVKTLLRQQDGVLVSIRTWSEFIGLTSGYSYIAEKGDIPGAHWGRAGRDGDVNSMSDFQGPDGSMRPPAEIAAFWAEAGIHSSQRTVFYCGTGWRASLAFFYAWLMDWERISVYDGGWYEWSRDPGHPVASGVRPPC